MELGTQAVDRVLEAVAPVLSRELERLVKEAEQNLDAEFRQKFQAALEQADAASLRVAEAQAERAIAETRDAVTRQSTEEFERLRAQLTEEFQKASAKWAAERARLTNELEECRVFAEAQQQLGEAGSQSEMLVRFLKLAERFAPSIALYISKADGLALWKTRGDTVFPNIVSQGTIDPELFYRQIVVKDKVLLAVCASAPCKEHGLNFLVSSLERSIGLFGMKLRSAI
jgi:arginyl-tRNA synthetase